MDTLKVFTAFSGYDSQMLALRRAGIDCDLVGWSEIDQYAIRAHDALFPEYKSRNYGDICKIDWRKVPDFDLLTYSSPCQDFSIAGNRQGGEKGSGTRSSLLWECERAIKTKKPKYLLFENVPGILTPSNKPNFDKWRKKLESLGYANHYEVLNAADFGVPQGRKRIYMFSVLGGKEADIKYPKPRPLNKTIVDMIETNVPKDYFLSDKSLISRINEGLRKYDRGMNFKFAPIDTSGIARTLRTSSGKLTDNYIVSYSRDDYGNIKNYHPKDISNTLTCQPARGQQSQYLKWRGKIRRLTPLEYFRLMGLRDGEAKKIMSLGISDTQLYKLAGNSIVIDVLEAIFKKMFKGGKSRDEGLGGIEYITPDEWRQEVRTKAKNPHLVIVCLIYANKFKARKEFVLVDRSNEDNEVFLTKTAYNEYLKAGVKVHKDSLLDKINKWMEDNKKILSTAHSEMEMGHMGRKTALLVHKEERLAAMRFRMIEELYNGNKSDFKKSRSFKLLDFSDFDKLLKTLELEFSVMMLRDYISRLRYTNTTSKKQVRL